MCSTCLYFTMVIIAFISMFKLAGNISGCIIHAVMAAISKQEDKFIRLEKLIDLGTKALRHKFNILLPPYKLQKQMETFKPTITHRISRQEFDRLYPQGGGNNL